MSERSFFSFRYSAPGLLFIIGVFIVFPEVVVFLFTQKEGNAISAVFLGILSVFGGSAIGVPISQVWYTIYQQVIKRMGWQYEAKAIDHIFCKYSISKDSLKNKHEQELLCDYLIQYCLSIKEKSDRIGYYLSRRWDMANTIASSITAIWFGIIIGWMFRSIIFNEIISDITNSIVEKLSTKICCYFVVVLFIMAFITISSYLSYNHIRDESNEMIKALINEMNIPQRKIIKAFPKISGKCCRS